MNRVWENITPEELDFLAAKTNEFIQRVSKENAFNTINEIQIDSDWTAGTKADYFAFLKKLKQISEKDISCKNHTPSSGKGQKEYRYSTRK